MNTEPNEPAADSEFGPPVPCVLVVTRGRQDLVPARIHPLLNEIEVFRLPTEHNLPDWLDDVYKAPAYGFCGWYIPDEIKEAQAPKLEPSTVVVLVDFAGLNAEPQFPGQEPTPFVRVGPLADLDKPLSNLPEVMILPGMGLSAAVGPMVTANLVL